MASSCASTSAAFSSLIVSASGSASISACTSSAVMIGALSGSLACSLSPAVYFPQSSANAPSTPQTEHAVFIASAVQAVSQAHTGGSSPPPSDGVTASSAGSTCFPHFSGKAPSAPQTVQSAFMSSDLQAVSQMHVGAASPPSSAKAAVGSVESTMTNTSRMLSSRFFIAVPFLSVLCVSRTPRERVVSVIPGWYMHHQYNIQLG